MANQNFSIVSLATHMSEVHSVDMKNPKENQQSDGKRKRKGKKRKLGTDKKVANNASEGKTRRKRLSFHVSFARTIT